jgi:hypothetical protein
MNVVLELVISVCLFLYYILEATVLLFVPSKLRSKDVKGQIVLVTGGGEYCCLPIFAPEILSPVQRSSLAEPKNDPKMM